ncbi:MAG: hypothetical protein HUK06_01645 [Bacteroidaceae bacterium]|nr:hypothetical protein [Bacteroidaceae bacterium]
MSRYFFVLNWLQLAVLLLIHFCLITTMGVAVTLGCALGGMLTAGLPSWMFHKDTDPNKDMSWRYKYFNKEYRHEVFFHFGVLLLTSTTLVFPFWHPFFRFIWGLSLMFFSAVMFETAYYYVFINIRKK